MIPLFTTGCDGCLRHRAGLDAGAPHRHCRPLDRINDFSDSWSHFPFLAKPLFKYILPLQAATRSCSAILFWFTRGLFSEVLLVEVVDPVKHDQYCVGRYGTIARSISGLLMGAYACCYSGFSAPRFSPFSRLMLLWPVHGEIQRDSCQRRLPVKRNGLRSRGTFFAFTRELSDSMP